MSGGDGGGGVGEVRCRGGGVKGRRGEKEGVWRGRGVWGGGMSGVMGGWAGGEGSGAGDGEGPSLAGPPSPPRSPG